MFSLVITGRIAHISLNFILKNIWDIQSHMDYNDKNGNHDNQQNWIITENKLTHELATQDEK